MISLDFNDKNIVVDSEDKSTNLQDKHSLLVTQKIDPNMKLFKRNSVTLKKIVIEDEHKWPSITWINDKPHEHWDETNNTYIQYKSQIVTDLWATSLYSSPDPSKPLPFADLIYSLEFRLDPATTFLQKHHISGWLLDLCSELGGFIVFSWLVSSFFCQTIP